MPITATKPHSAPAVSAMVFDQWYVTQIVGKFDGTKGPTIVTMQKANLTNGIWTLMPNTTPDASVTFNLDVLKEIEKGNVTMGTAFTATVAAIGAYAVDKKLV